MRSQARAVVVGGGAVGASIAYHLAKAGWTDTVLLERDELTSGSTWHAAGLLPLFNMGYATSHIHDYSVKLYKTLEAETGLNAGFSVVGNLRMAQTRARMDEFELYAATAETVGVPFEWLTPGEIGERWPLVRTEDLVGALFHPTDGYINPADVTQAMAKGARQRGVEIVRKAQVDGYEWTGSEWIVRGRMMTERGGNLVPSDETFEIRAEHVVTATGNHAQRTAQLLGIQHPGDPGRAPVYRHRARPGARRVPQGQPRAPGPARRRRAAGTSARSAAAGSSAPTRTAPRPASSTRSPTASAPTSSRSTSSGSRPSTCR